MEFVSGETLAEVIARGAITMDEALPIARQIGEALNAAHERGIIHRDLKPANVKVSPDGHVKVLDFGLAKALEPAGSSAGLMNSPTLTAHATQLGVILGTAAYMSPEQARGKPLDKRTDIFSFGCVLYEMLTGVRAFDGDDVTTAIAAVVRAEPGWDKLPADTPASIHRLLRRCLEKDRADRLPDIGMARLEIKDASAAGADTRAATPSKRERVAWTAAAVFGLTALAAGWMAWSSLGRETGNGPNSNVYRSTLVRAPNLNMVGVTSDPITRSSVSPDGRRLA